MVRYPIIFLTIFLFKVIPGNAQAWQWVDRLGGTGNENAQTISSSTDNKAFILGSYESSFNIPNGNLPEFGGNDIFLAQIGDFGTLNWVVGGGSSDNDLPGGLIGLSDGSAIISGRYWDEADFGGINLERNQGSSSAIFVAKYDANGNIDWAKSIDGAGIKVVNQLEKDAADNFYICGYYGDTLFTELGALTSLGNTAAFILKYNSSGTLLWAKSYGNTFNVRATAIGIDANSNVYVAGDSDGSFDFNGETITTNTVDNDVFLMKLDAVGNELWAKRFGGGLEDNATGLAALPNGKIYLTGKFIGLFDIGGTTLQTQGFNDNIFLCSISDLGNTLWAKSLGSTGFEISTGISAFGSEFAITGYYQGTTDIDGEILMSGPTETNAFMAIFDESGALNLVERIEGMDFDLALSVDYDPMGGILTCGQFESEVSLGGVEATSAGGFDVFFGRWVFISSISEQPAFRQMQIFPNPAVADVFIELSDEISLPQEIKVYQTDGRLFRQFSLSQANFSVADWPSGLYLLQGEDFVSRLVKH